MIFATYYNSQFDAHGSCNVAYEVRIFGRIGTVTVMIESSGPDYPYSWEDDYYEVLKVLAQNRVIDVQDVEEPKAMDSPWWTESGWIDSADVEQVTLVKRWKTFEHAFCDDCVQALANDDYSGITGDVRASAVSRGIDELMEGTVWLGERDEFSCWKCDCCGDKWAGARTHSLITQWQSVENASLPDGPLGRGKNGESPRSAIQS